jgi:hypothetical protein
MGVTDLRSAIDEYDWEELLEYSRLLYAQVENLGFAVWQKNTYAVGSAWEAQYTGTNKKWGEEAEEWLREQWYPNCDVRGGVFDFRTNLFLSALAWDVDGDDVAICAVREDGFPLIKHCGAHEIGSRSQDTQVKGGPLDGAKIHNGVIVDSQKRFLGVKVLGEKPSEDQVVPAYNCDFRFEPQWRHGFRGIPRIGAGIMTWFRVQDIDTFLGRGVALDSSIGLMHYTEEGGAPTGTDLLEGRGTGDSGNEGVEASDIKFERRMGGEIYYMRAGKGEKIEGLKSDRPHPNTEAFVARLERRGLNAVAWHYELLNPEKLKGASNRMIQDQANAAILSRQLSLGPRAKRAVRFAISQAQEAGFISKNPDPDDQFRWDFDLPAELTVDKGNDDDADREGIKLGTRTLSSVCQKRGGKNWEKVRTQQAKENKDWIDRALELVAYTKERGEKLSFREALDMVRKDNPNARPDPAAEAKAKGGKEEEEE